MAAGFYQLSGLTLRRQPSRMRPSISPASAKWFCPWKGKSGSGFAAELSRGMNSVGWMTGLLEALLTPHIPRVLLLGCFPPISTHSSRDWVLSHPMMERQGTRHDPIA